ncbi:putative proline-rich protein [Laccaria bicolor S238N-H82]|uniref:Hypothetical proline-rich protein n=1 Tax=Laccaria bicolor (strain S238N-H82 / ATCC MYA-4686) TaxID=486041 RepID=B0DBZ2_LACBS|nr:putative proline-rich protein [Laccaria bicolor S238N-H82]EDR07803.1 hypothetical proline-rich protein [Laccaria bicolor S238N-H82]|eukprot:XP_001881592.1 hypothetical proline-rich protein [Laccaria bicolor S238N-H82]
MNSSEEAQLVYGTQCAMYVKVAVAVVALYDHRRILRKLHKSLVCLPFATPVTTLELELNADLTNASQFELIWKKRWSIVKILFIINRYFAEGLILYACVYPPTPLDFIMGLKAEAFTVSRQLPCEGGSMGEHSVNLVNASILFPLIAFIVGGVNVFVWSRLAEGLMFANSRSAVAGSRSLQMTSGTRIGGSRSAPRYQSGDPRFEPSNTLILKFWIVSKTTGNFTLVELGGAWWSGRWRGGFGTSAQYSFFPPLDLRHNPKIFSPLMTLCIYGNRGRERLWAFKVVRNVHVESGHYHFPSPSYVHMDTMLGYSFASFTQQAKFQTYVQAFPNQSRSRLRFFMTTVALIWRKKWSLVNIFFIISRQANPGFVEVLILQFSPKNVSQECITASKVQGWGCHIMIWSMQAHGGSNPGPPPSLGPSSSRPPGPPPSGLPPPPDILSSSGFPSPSLLSPRDLNLGIGDLCSSN